MITFLVRLTLMLFSLCALSLPAIAGRLDDHYLAAFGAQPAPLSDSSLHKVILLPAAEGGGTPHCGTPLKHGLQRDWNSLEPATRKILAKQLAAPALSGTELTLLSSGGRFLIHYTLSGTDAVPSLAWVQTVAQTFEDVINYYVSRGWNQGPTVNGAPYDVYLRELAFSGLYGQTTSTARIGFANSYASFMEIDNNFTDGIYTSANGGPYTALQSLQITAAHEYHHAIQYGYNFYFDIWYAEATSTWLEDELYDGVNQLYNYIPGWFVNSTKSIDLAVGADATTSGAGYGRWIFNRYLAEQHSTDFIRNSWVSLAGLSPSSSQTNSDGDIRMVPVLESLLLTSPFNSTLGTDFFGFAKRVYTRDWTTPQSEIDKIHPYSPVATYSTYPVSSSTSSPAPSVTLSHYSFAYYKFIPAASVPSLTITIAKSSGIQTAAFRKSSGAVTEIAANAGGGSYTDNAFDSSDEVVLLVANTTGLDGHSANFTTDGSSVSVAEPTTPALHSSGGSGCFIATAAYGSYLHPQVQLLRNFRDDFLLTNVPGRAFVAFYYRCSPPLADFIARHPALRSVTRLALTPIVVAVAHPLISAVSLFLLVGALLISLLRRIKTARLNAHTYVIRTT
ncbi:MAG: MXAN_6640 family putative metalloprotease [Desulfuromonadaceae bacterium]